MNIHEYQAKAVLREFGVPVLLCRAAGRGGGQGAWISARLSSSSRRRSMPVGAARPAA